MNAFSGGALIMVALVIFTMVLRKRALAATAVTILYVTFFCLSAQRPASIPSYVVIALGLAFLALRYGPIAVVVTQGTFFALLNAPLLPGAGWATATAPVTLLAVMALALWAFYTSLGSQPMFSASLLDE